MVDYAIFLQHKMHSPRDGEAYLNAAVKLCDNGVTNLQMGKFLSREKRYQDAIKYFCKGIKLNTEMNNIHTRCNCVSCYECGIAAYRIENYDKAEKMFIEAIRIDKEINNGLARLAPKGTINIYNELKKKFCESIDNNNNKHKILNHNNNNNNNNNSNTKTKTSTNVENDWYVDGNTNGSSNSNSDENKNENDSGQKDKQFLELINEENLSEMEKKVMNIGIYEKNTIHKITDYEIDPLAQEFGLFWQELPYFKSTKDKYFEKFVLNEWNCISMIKLMTNDMLINDIGMDLIHAKLFQDFASRIIDENNKFLQWLESFEFSKEYELALQRIGVYSFSAFHRRFENVDSLINTLKVPSNIDFVSDDCHELWQNTPRYKRIHTLKKKIQV